MSSYVSSFPFSLDNSYLSSFNKTIFFNLFLGLIFMSLILILDMFEEHIS